MSRPAPRRSSSRAGDCASTVGSTRSAPQRAEPSAFVLRAVESLACLRSTRPRRMTRESLRTEELYGVHANTATDHSHPGIPGHGADRGRRPGGGGHPKTDRRGAAARRSGRRCRLRRQDSRRRRRTSHLGHQPQRFRRWLASRRAHGKRPTHRSLPSRGNDRPPVTNQDPQSVHHRSGQHGPRRGRAAARPPDHRRHPRRHPPPPADPIG